MAILRSTTNFFARGTSAVEITPNAPLDRALVDTYQIRLWAFDKLVYERVQSVRDWQMRHFYVQEIARACCAVHLLIDQTISVQTNPPDGNEQAFLSLVHVVMSTDWLTFSLSAAHTKKYGDLIHIDVYAEVEEITVGSLDARSAGAWSEYQSLIGIKLSCKPEDATAFGQELLAEIRQVEQQRIALGIGKYDDPLYGNPGEDE